MKKHDPDASARCDIIMGNIIALSDKLLAGRDPNYMNKAELDDLLRIQIELEDLVGVPNADRLRGVD